MLRKWLAVGVWTAFGCAPASSGGMETSGGSMTGGGSTPGESTEASGSSSSSEGGEATTDYPTHVTCDDTGAGYDIPSLDSGGGGSSGGAEDTFDGMGDDIPIGATVFQVRQQEVPAGSWVEIADLVVTSPPAARPNGGAMMFAQAPEGGPYSAITLLFPAADETEGLDIGDRVRVRGDVGERYVFTAIFVDFEGVLEEGTAELPAPVVLGPADLEPGAAATDGYESALVRVENPQVDEPDSCVGEFTLDVGVGVDDLFLGAAAPDPAAGDTFSAVTGPLRYTYNGFEIAPRTLADVEP